MRNAKILESSTLFQLNQFRNVFSLTPFNIVYKLQEVTVCVCIYNATSLKLKIKPKQQSGALIVLYLSIQSLAIVVC